MGDWVIFYLRQGERSEHWRRLRDWSFCVSVILCFCVCTWWLIIAMTSLHQQRKQQSRLLHFLPSLAAKWLFLLPPISLCLNHFTWWWYALSRAPSSLMLYFSGILGTAHLIFSLDCLKEISTSNLSKAHEMRVSLSSSCSHSYSYSVLQNGREDDARIQMSRAAGQLLWYAASENCTQ